MDIEAVHTPTTRALVNRAIGANPAIGFDHLLQVIENVSPGHLANVETVAQFAVHLVPGPPESAVQESLERPKHVGEPLAVGAILPPPARRYELELILVVGIRNKWETLAPLAVSPGAAAALPLNHHFVHVFTHCPNHFSSVRRHRLRFCCSRRGTCEKRIDSRPVSAATLRFGATPPDPCRSRDSRRSASRQGSLAPLRRMVWREGTLLFTPGETPS